MTLRAQAQAMRELASARPVRNRGGEGGG